MRLVKLNVEWPCDDCFIVQRLVKIIAKYAPNKFSVLLIRINSPGTLKPYRQYGRTSFVNRHSWPDPALILPPTIKHRRHFCFLSFGFHLITGGCSTVLALLFAQHVNLPLEVKHCRKSIPNWGWLNHCGKTQKFVAVFILPRNICCHLCLKCSLSK